MSVIFTLLFIATLYVSGYCVVWCMDKLADKLGWYTKELKMSYIERKMMEYMNR